MGKNNYPQAGINDIDPTAVQQTVTSLLGLSRMGKPANNEELRQRIDGFFAFCQGSSIRPGVESLALAIGVSRQTLFKWLRGQNCDQERTEIVQAAKGVIDAFIEQAVLSGKVNPVTGIFIMKNWMGYTDAGVNDFIHAGISTRFLNDAELPDLRAGRSGE